MALQSFLELSVSGKYCGRAFRVRTSSVSPILQQVDSNRLQLNILEAAHVERGGGGAAECRVWCS
jgi:hypothetical protein